LIAQTGGDGGENCIDILNYSQSGIKLRQIRISTYDEDFEKGYTRQFDSTITDIDFNNRKTTYKKLTEVSRLDTIWDKK
jgi:hypothetical protein